MSPRGPVWEAESVQHRILVPRLGGPGVLDEDVDSDVGTEILAEPLNGWYGVEENGVRAAEALLPPVRAGRSQLLAGGAGNDEELGVSRYGVQDAP